MVVVLIILAIVLFFISASLHNSADEQEAKFNNRPSTIASPLVDLLVNQKFAIVNILAFAQGATSSSAYSDEANTIVNQWLSKLGLSKSDMEKSIRLSMSCSPERSFQRIRESMLEIKDKAFVHSVYCDVQRIAQISGDQDTIEFVEDFFNDILIH